MNAKHNRTWVLALIGRMAFAASLVSACSALPSREALSADEAALWHCRITVNSAGSGKAATPEAPVISAYADVEESLAPLILEFDVNQNVEPIRGTLKASYTWSSRHTQIFMGMLLFESMGYGRGSNLEDWEVVLTRHFDPIGCDFFFFVDDEWERTFAPEFPPKTYSTPAFDPDMPPSHYEMNLARTMHLSRRKGEGDKLDFRIRAAFPVTVISKNYDSGETTTDTWTNSFQDSGEVDYDYRKETQSMRPEPVSGVYGTGVILPQIDVSRHTVDIEITRKPVEFTLQASPGKGNESAIRFKNTITVGGLECSKLFKVRRLERDWFHMYDPAGTLTSWEMVNDWHDVTGDGNLAAEREVSFESFFPPKSPRNAWGHRFYVAEFLDCVERFPELGFLYHVVTLETHLAGSTRMEITAHAAEAVNAERVYANRPHRRLRRFLPVVPRAPCARPGGCRRVTGPSSRRQDARLLHHRVYR